MCPFCNVNPSGLFFSFQNKTKLSLYSFFNIIGIAVCGILVIMAPLGFQSSISVCVCVCISALHIFYVQFLLLMPFTRKVSKMVHSNSHSHQNESASDELICKTEIESKMQKTNLRSSRGKRGREGSIVSLGLIYTHYYI